VSEPEPEPAWILYDGLCGLCDRWVRWLLARDRRAAFRFAPLQGATAAEVRARHPELNPALPPPDETVILVERPESAGERVRVRSDAALAIVARLGGLWRLAALLRAVPRPLRDAAYRCIARRRKRWFGVLPACRRPAAAERARFLE
jgi:predicted DCC family thiol-disulfide oxidoreductase YuxK